MKLLHSPHPHPLLGQTCVCCLPAAGGQQCAALLPQLTVDELPLTSSWGMIHERGGCGRDSRDSRESIYAFICFTSEPSESAGCSLMRSAASSSKEAREEHHAGQNVLHTGFAAMCRSAHAVCSSHSADKPVRSLCGLVVGTLIACFHLGPHISSPKTALASWPHSLPI